VQAVIAAPARAASFKNSRRVVSLNKDLLATLRCFDRLDIDRPIMNFRGAVVKRRMPELVPTDNSSREEKSVNTKFIPEPSNQPWGGSWVTELITIRIPNPDSCNIVRLV
jgi:hypothetical protein